MDPKDQLRTLGLTCRGPSARCGHEHHRFPDVPFSHLWPHLCCIQASALPHSAGPGKSPEARCCQAPVAWSDRKMVTYVFLFLFSFQAQREVGGSAFSTAHDSGFPVTSCTPESRPPPCVRKSAKKAERHGWGLKPGHGPLRVKSFVWVRVNLLPRSNYRVRGDCSRVYREACLLRLLPQR